MASTVFFEQPKKNNKHHGLSQNDANKMVRLNLHGHAELTCATLLVNAYRDGLYHGQDLQSEQLLSHLFKSFPNQARPYNVPDFLTPSKYMQQLCIEQTQLHLGTTFIERLALMLKCMVIQTLLDNPSNYTSLYLNPLFPLSVRSVTENELGLNPWFLKALADALPIAVVQHEVIDNKPFPKKMIWPNKAAVQLRAYIQWEQSRCIVYGFAENKPWINSIQQNPPQPIALPSDFVQRATCHALDNQKKIHDEARNNIERYHAIHERLSTMWAKNAVSEMQLSDLYIASLSENNAKLLKNSPFGTQALHQLTHNACHILRDTAHNQPHADFPKQLIDAVTRGIWLGFIRDITLNMNHQPLLNTPCD